MHYLGHVISQEVVATDPTKIEAILEWPILETVKHIMGLMGLSGIITYLLKTMHREPTNEYNAEKECEVYLVYRSSIVF